MIGALRQGAVVYVLDKSDGLTLRMGRVESVTSPQPKFGSAYQLAPETTIDMVVKMEDGAQTEYKGVPTASVSANFGNVTLAETKEAILGEVDNLVRMAEEVLGKEAYYRSIIEGGDKVREALNPNIAKERETERRIGNLEGSLSRIEEMLSKALKSK